MLQKLLHTVVLFLAVSLLTNCAREQADFRYLVWDKEIKKVLYCPTEQECERIKKIYTEYK